MIATFEGQTPQIGAGAYIHPSADVFGNVQIGANCWIGPGARIRGDYGRLVVGDTPSVADTCVIPARPDAHTRDGYKIEPPAWARNAWVPGVDDRQPKCLRTAGAT